MVFYSPVWVSLYPWFLFLATSWFDVLRSAMLFLLTLAVTIELLYYIPNIFELLYYIPAILLFLSLMNKVFQHVDLLHTGSCFFYLHHSGCKLLRLLYVKILGDQQYLKY